MEALFAIALGLLTASGVYLLLRARTFSVGSLSRTSILCSRPSSFSGAKPRRYCEWISCATRVNVGARSVAVFNSK